MSMPFSTDEYAARMAMVRQRMHEQNLDIVLAFGQDQMFYLTGYDQIGYSYYQVLIIPRDQPQIVYLCREVDAHIIRETSVAEDIRVWYDDHNNDPAQVTVDIVREFVNLPGSRIGVELQTHGLLPMFHARLAAQLGSATCVDVSSLLTDLRLEKSPAEVSYMREAGKLFDVGMHAGFAAMREGDRECDIHAAVMHATYAAGGEFPAVAPPIESGPRTLHQTHGAALRRTLEAGDPVTLEIGACFRRYHAVGVRSAAIRSASAAQQRLHRILKEAIQAGLGKAGPGVASAEVAQSMHDVYLANGIDRRTRHCGYGTGIGYPPTWIDNLRIKLTDPHILKPGMTFMMHGILADWEAKVAVALGDPVLITETGIDRLTTLDHELVLCD